MVLSQHALAAQPTRARPVDLTRTYCTTRWRKEACRATTSRRRIAQTTILCSSSRMYAPATTRQAARHVDHRVERAPLRGAGIALHLAKDAVDGRFHERGFKGDQAQRRDGDYVLAERLSEWPDQAYPARRGCP